MGDPRNNSSYSREVLDMKFQNLEEKIDGNHTETLEKMGEGDRRNHDKQLEILNFLSEIKVQTTEHNHRMSKTEGWIRGIIMCCSLIIVVVLPLLIYIWNSQSKQILQNQKDIRTLQIGK